MASCTNCPSLERRIHFTAAGLIWKDRLSVVCTALEEHSSSILACVAFSTDSSDAAPCCRGIIFGLGTLMVLTTKIIHIPRPKMIAREQGKASKLAYSNAQRELTNSIKKDKYPGRSLTYFKVLNQLAVVFTKIFNLSLWEVVYGTIAPMPKEQGSSQVSQWSLPVTLTLWWTTGGLQSHSLQEVLLLCFEGKSIQLCGDEQ